MIKNKFLWVSALSLLFCSSTYPFLKHFLGSNLPKLEQAYGKDNLVPVVIIGSGPAGLSAALYTARAKLPTVVLTGDEIGGQLASVREIENWPGQKEKYSGAQIMDDLTNQAKRFGANIVLDGAKNVDLSEWPFTIETENGEKLKAMSIIVATGRIPKKLDVPGVQKYWGRGIGTCTICEAPFHKGNIVSVVGGGDTAADRALQLANYAKKVFMFVTHDELDANGTVQEYLKNTKNIQILLNTDIKAITGTDDEIKSVIVENNKTGKQLEIPISGLYFAIGYHPNSDLVKGAVNLDAKGFIKTNCKNQATNVPGVFTAGDVCESYGKAGVATGSGVKAGIDTIEFLQDIGVNLDVIRKLSGQFFIKRAMREHTISLVKSLEQFQGIINHNEYVVVDFFANYCPTCKALLPHLKEIGAYYENKIKIVKVDHEDSPEIGNTYNVASVPHFIIFKNGKPIARRHKILSQQELKKFIDETLQQQKTN